MKKQFIFILLLLPAFYVNLSAQYSIEGVWALYPEARLPYEGEEAFTSEELSWGKRNFFRNIYMIIDLHSDRPIFVILEFCYDPIIAIEEHGNRTELTFHFLRGDYFVSIVCHFNEDGTMWIEKDNIQDFPLRDRIFYKIDGPEFPEINYHLRSQQNINDVYIEEDSSDGKNTNILTENIILSNENIAVDSIRSNEIIAVSLDQDFIQTDNEDSFINQSSKKWLWLLLLLLIPLIVIVVFLTRKQKK